MKVNRLLQEGCITLKNLISPKSHTLLEEIWKDTGGSCRTERKPGWGKSTADISVIIPCYNNAPFLEKSLQSVLDQKGNFTLEAVVIDDGSTDETPEILAKFAKDPRVILCRQENQGHSGARNTGLQLCHGEYILFHDSDDTMCPGALEALLTQAQKNDADIVAGGYRCVAMDGKEIPGKQFPDGKAEDIYAIPGMTCGKIFRRRLLRNLQFPSGYWYEDSVICQILLPLAKQVYTVSHPVFIYLVNPKGVSAASQGQPKSLESLYVTRKLLKERESFGLQLDEGCFGHFLYMVLLTYHRTRKLGKVALYPVFEAQCELYAKYYGHFSAPQKYAGLVSALKKRQFRRYLWLCETLWLGGKV